MAQQQSKNTRFLLLFFYLAFLAWWWFLGPRPVPPDPAQAANALVQAKELEKQGRDARDRTLSLDDRKKKLEQAIAKYEEYFSHNRNAADPRLRSDAMAARFQVINIYDYLATTLEGPKSGTHWYDQAEHKLKEMEKAFLHKNGKVTLEVGGRTREASGDLGRIASERLNEIRAARDESRRDAWTYRSLDILVAITGRSPHFSYWFALALIVVVLKALTYPFQRKQAVYMRDMNRVAPLVKAAQEEMKAKGRPQDEISRRIFEIYKENNVSLTGGCLPMLVLMLVLFPVFWMVRDYEYQFTNGYFLWIGSETSRHTWWLADNLAQFDVPLFVIYMVSMVAQMALQPKPADPQQAQQQKIMLYAMPLMFGVMMWMWQWSSAFMFYWLVLNLVSTYQSWMLNRQLGHASAARAAAPAPAPQKGAAPAAATAPAPEPSAPLRPMAGVRQKRKPGSRKGKDRTGELIRQMRERQRS